MVEFCIHAANLFYLASFVGRDMLWLRALTCCGLVFGLVFFTCGSSPLYGPAVWHVVFLGINAVQIVRLVRERREVALSKEQERLGEAALAHLSRDELLVLLTKALHAKPGELADIEQAARKPLTPEEKVLCDVAFRRLSYRELLNLAVRRLWNIIKRANPRRCRSSGGDAPPPPAPAAAEAG